MAAKRVAPGPGRASGVVKSPQPGSKTGFYLLILVVAVSGIGVLSYLSAQSRKNTAIAIDPNLPAVTSQGYVTGSPNAPLEVIEFGDFECVVCNSFFELTEPQVRSEYINTGKIRFRFIDSPIPSLHPHTLNASVAAACADQQGQFWPMHDILFSKQDAWNGAATNDPDKVIKSLAHTIPGIDAPKFDQCVDTRQTLGKVQSHMKIGIDRNIRGTPTFIIGAKEYQNIGFDEFKQAVDEALAAADTAKRSAAGSAKPAGKSTKKP